jgi:transposase
MINLSFLYFLHSKGGRKMANTMKMEKKDLIQALLKKGWSYRRIQDETGIRRETVSKYDPDNPKNSKTAKVPADPIQDRTENRPNCPPTNDENVSQNSSAINNSSSQSLSKKPTRISCAAPFDNVIREKLALGLSAQRIYQDLVVEHGFASGYDSVKRYVRKLANATPKVFARIHTKPGEEGQVDFGKGAPTLKNGRYARPWFFKMVLSHSRHSYEEVVWTQDVESFIQCHENAFEDFGGVPDIIRLDNLKSGVLIAHLFEPQLNPIYEAFAKHCGFAILPCLPGKPEHKGKTESGVGYTKDNALKGLTFTSLKAQNDHLRAWNKRWARTRIHGTTKKQVWSVFIDEERPALKPLPDQLFQFFHIGKRKVHNDGHIEVSKAFYSVPHQLVGNQVDVQFNSKWVKVFSADQLICFHRATEPGRFQTEKKHLPENKCLSTEDYKDKLLSWCRGIGPGCYLWALKVINERHQLGFRAIQGVLHLRKQYSNTTINNACTQTLKLGSARYHTVKLLCEDQNPSSETYNGIQLEFLQNHEMIRDLEEYQQYFENRQKIIK